MRDLNTAVALSPVIPMIHFQGSVPGPINHFRSGTHSVPAPARDTSANEMPPKMGPGTDDGR